MWDRLTATGGPPSHQLDPTGQTPSAIAAPAIRHPRQTGRGSDRKKIVKLNQATMYVRADRDALGGEPKAVSPPPSSLARHRGPAVRSQSDSPVRTRLLVSCRRGPAVGVAGGRSV